MGYAIAEAARDRGANVVLVAAPTALQDPPGIEVAHVETAEEMGDAVLTACAGADALVMAAAVADFRVAEQSAQKIKRRQVSELSLHLVPNEDFFNKVPLGVLRIGFSAESQDLLPNARETLESKGLDLVVANDITLPDAGFGADTNKVTLLDASGTDDLPLMSKYDVAGRILDRVAGLLASTGIRTAT